MKSDILSPSQVEQIEKLMILGQATQKDGVRLVNSHRALWVLAEAEAEAEIESLLEQRRALHGPV